uniref:Ig_7 domain-containing protein n=1 Tax=Parastrongyloides trichosuri TaxID=131310 RepID=A0A0N5A7I6_PARTI
QCDAYSTALKIVVYDKVTISNAGIDISVCETSAISLNANTVGPNETGIWSVISPLNYQPFSPSDINNPNASINNLPVNQEVILKWTITNTICNTSSSDLVTIVNYQLPANTISANQTLFCNGKADITITGSTPINIGNPLTYRWQQSLNGIDWTDIQNAIEKDLSVPEFYQTTWFRRIITIGQCDAYSTALKIVVYDKVTISNAGIDISVCETPAISLNANTVGSNEAGTWSVISPLDYQPFSPSDINNPNASINNLPANQEVILKWTITNTICNTSSSDLVTIVNYQLPANTISANQTLFCDGKADMTITGSTPINIGNPLTYRWQQ